MNVRTYYVGEVVATPLTELVNLLHAIVNLMVKNALTTWKKVLMIIMPTTIIIFTE